MSAEDPLVEDPARLGELIESSEADPSSGGIGVGSSFRDRLMNDHPDTPLDEVEGVRIAPKDAAKNAAKYGTRGLRKFMGKGSTALEDLLMAGVNGCVAIYRELTGRGGGGSGGAEAVAVRGG